MRNKLSALVLAISVSIALPAQSFADEDLNKEIESISVEIDKQNDHLLQVEEKIKEGEDQLRKIEEEIQAENGHLGLINSSILGKQSDINNLAVQSYIEKTVSPFIKIMGTKSQDSRDKTLYLKALGIESADKLSSLEVEKKRSEKEISAKRDLAEERKSLVDGLKEDKSKSENLRKELEKKKDELKEKLKGNEESYIQYRQVDTSYTQQTVKKALDDGSYTGDNGVVKSALSKLGAPYSWGAVGPDAFDCSGLVYWAYQQNGKTIPRTSQGQANGGSPVSYENLKPGDVVIFYPGATHSGIYIGNGKVVNAVDYGIPLSVVPLDSMPFYGARRY